MAPNDGSGVRVGRKGGEEGGQLMGRFGPGPGGPLGLSPHKDRLPDHHGLPVRTTRRSALHDPPLRRRRVQTAHDRKRAGEDDSLGGDRRIKLPRPSSPSPVNGVTHLNGCVNGEAADLLHRLSGLAEAGDRRPVHRNNGVVKEALQKGVGHLLAKNGVKVFNGGVKGRVNGAHRMNGVRVVRGGGGGGGGGGVEGGKMELHTNNNVDPLPPSPRLPLPHALTTAHAPTSAKRATQGFPHPTQDLSWGCDVAGAPPLSPRIAEPPLSPTSARCSAKSSPPPARASPAPSKSRSSSAGSSAPSSGTSTPTPTVRFPPPEKKEVSDVCRWRNCNQALDPAISLLEHIQAVHVEGQLEAESFRCLWVGCKVYDKASCSVSWLERHVLTHGGHKPFKCIVDGCGQRFTSQNMLGRHVNNHFSVAATTPSPRPPTQPSPTKLIRKNGRKCRYRKKPWSAARMFDMFDVGVMECLRWRLLCVTEVQNASTSVAPGQNFTLNPQILARRTCLKGTQEVLVRWLPAGVLADEWVALDELESVRKVALEQLSAEAKQTVSQLCYPSHPRPHQHRRKQPSCPKSLSLEVTKAV